MQITSNLHSNVSRSTRINSSSVHTYIFVCFTLRVFLQGFVTQNATKINSEAIFVFTYRFWSEANRRMTMFMLLACNVQHGLFFVLISVDCQLARTNCEETNFVSVSFLFQKLFSVCKIIYRINR